MPLDHRFFAVVRAAQAMPVADTAALQRSTSPREAMEARLLVEPELAGLATINATYEQIAAIRALAEQTRSSQSWSLYEENDLRLHHLIVEASGNKLLVSVHEVVNEVRRTVVWPRLDTIAAGPPSNYSSFAEHDAIVSSIERRNREGAKEAMRQHLLTTLSRLTGPRI
jgi:DNA-binding FadR family transcriptional regulator